MTVYRNILFATSLTEETDLVADKVRQLAEQHQAKLSIVHIIEDAVPPHVGYEVAVPFDFSQLDETIREETKTKLNDLGAKVGVLESNQYIVCGFLKEELNKLIEHIDADLIVVGSHNQSGLSLFFSSTANHLIQAVSCDVLAIHID